MTAGVVIQMCHRPRTDRTATEGNWAGWKCSEHLTIARLRHSTCMLCIVYSVCAVAGHFHRGKIQLEFWPKYQSIEMYLATLSVVL